MLEKHKAQNEAWLKARAEENDKERKEIYKLRVNIYKSEVGSRTRHSKLRLQEPDGRSTSMKSGPS